MSSPGEQNREETEAELHRRIDQEVQRQLDQADPDELPAINEVLRGQKDFRWTPQRLNRYTRLVRMKAEHILRLGGIKEVYTKALIPDSVLMELANPESDERLERDGMLHRFDIPPVAASAKVTREELMSIEERMVTKLQQSEEWVTEVKNRRQRNDTSIPKIHGVYPEIYEGTILQAEGKDQILAWMTWSRSLQPDPEKRTIDNDALTQEVDRILESIHYFDDFKRTRKKIYKDVLQTRIGIIDTLQSVTPGAATEIMSRLMEARSGRSWKDAYSYAMGYRHSELQFLEKKKNKKSNFSRGGNKQSGRVWYERDFRDMGTRQSNVIAERDTHPKIRIRPIERWMFAKINDIAIESAALAKKALKRFN